jgi:hypothetical protein
VTDIAGWAGGVCRIDLVLGLFYWLPEYPGQQDKKEDKQHAYRHQSQHSQKLSML